ncbi:phage tail tube protein, partial [Clostridium perfringens]
FAIADPATPTNFVDVGEVTSITPPSDTDDMVDATHTQSPNRTREFIAGLTDPGECSFEMNFVPGSPSDILIQDAKGKRKICRI